MGNRWIRTRIDYHPCIASEPTNRDIRESVYCLLYYYVINWSPIHDVINFEINLSLLVNPFSYRECLCDNWKPSFLPLLIFDWRTFSRWVTALWWRQWVKNQVSTNQNSRNRWLFIVRRTICTWSRKAEQKCKYLENK